MTPPRVTSGVGSYPAAEPSVYAPPCSHTITGSPRACAARAVPAAGPARVTGGVDTLTIRQSSVFVPSWAQLGGGRVASRTPDHGAAGCGAAKRSSPVGGAAYGMPENRRPSADTVPRTAPPEVSTVSGLPPSPGQAGAGPAAAGLAAG